VRKLITYKKKLTIVCNSLTLEDEGGILRGRNIMHVLDTFFFIQENIVELTIMTKEATKK
jgi:hypothetical protein